MNKFELYHGDCLEVMKQFPDNYFDACVTDPPYGIGAIDKRAHAAKWGWNEHLQVGEWDNAPPTKEFFVELIRVSKIQIIWGGNYFTDHLSPTMQWLIWDKGQRNFSLADFEMAWSSQNRAGRIFNYPRSAALGDGKVHPTQKPVALMRWCIEQLPKNTETIFDPFMGSGTTGVACAQLGRRFVGIELDADYFEIARKRIENAYAQPTLFEAVETKVESEQINLL